jgi:outer membrane scaffolding protein for murein synthesis (MipA/OmpV family)
MRPILPCLQFLLLLLPAWLVPCPAPAQTPSPLQEWQYSGGIALARLFEPELPEYRTVVGLAAETEPVYAGSRAYKVQSGPVLNFQYRDIAFISTGDGIGYNVFRGDHYQVGISLGYDFGRSMRDDYTNLRGMGDIGTAPVAKVFGTWVLSKNFPLVMRADARQFIGGAEGAVGDVGVYMPLPGSSRSFVLFAGPSVTLATQHYLQTVYGVSERQSLASGHPEFDPHAGLSAVGMGVSATKFLTGRWLLNVDAAVNRIWDDAAHSPIVEKPTQRVIAVSVDYQW